MSGTAGGPAAERTGTTATTADGGAGGAGEAGRTARLLQKITSTALGPYQSAVIRIGFSGTWLFYLLWEIPNRHELYGPDGPWSWQMADRFIANNDAFTVLMWSDSELWFEIVYIVAVLASLLLCLGWRTRTMSALFMVGVLSLQNRSIFVGDGGDNVIHLMAIYLLVTRCGQVWSLDARRAARSAPDAPDRVGPVLWVLTGTLLLVATVENRTGLFILLVLWGMWVGLALWALANRLGPRSQPRILLDCFANLGHNAGLLVIMAEVCLIYATAGWYKIQGSRWQDGTALYYPLKLDYFTPWPALSDLLAANGLMVLVLTYGTVIVQVAFPFTLFNRRVKNILLVVMIAEHAGIAIILGLPFFSLAMIAADAVFLPTAFLLWLGARAARGRDTLLSRIGRKPGAGDGDREPGPAPVVPEQRTGDTGQPRTLVG
ncbi:HTTM domain-containing protein [Streptomyces qinzhouensis]|uniref:HTTM domain-containing protein n=1 Tax=Streptomyces qinzhouensis TaxID=2599401 RepID=A0A5B8J925_9ACTN|nr:HTTM domain-containing protein [Streptomyces qinzhouensis]QDY77867.1 HTTM domain-containing protein [Streptomyces qinzhouensis]